MVLKTILTASVLLVATAAIAGVAAETASKVTVCHVPGQDPEKAHTIRISRSAWPSHERQGHHKGACTAADRDPDNIPVPPVPPPTRLGLHHTGDGDIYGDASFRVDVSNVGSYKAVDVTLQGTLDGDGEWKVRAPSGVKCTISETARLECDLGSVASGKEVAIRLSFDGRLSACDQAGIDLFLSAANDGTAGDDRADDVVSVGACSPLDSPPVALS